MRIHQFAVTLALIAAQGSASAAIPDSLKYCREDVARLCPGVPIGGGRLVACLKEHKMEVSVGCAQGLQKLKAQMGK